jgi:gas vesicle protein
MTDQTTPPPKPTPNNSYPDTFIDGVLVGLLIGAALVLWFSPQTGRELFESAKKYLPAMSIKKE